MEFFCEKSFKDFGGYADIYDEIFHTFTPTDHDKIYIGNDYTIWLW